MNTKLETSVDSKLIGRRLHLARTERGWSLERLAAEMHVSVATMRRYEKGEDGGHPSYIAVTRAARALGKPLEWFAGEAAE